MLEVSTDKLSFASEGATKSLLVRSSDPWLASSSESWLTLSQSMGKGDATDIDVVSSANFDSRERSAVIRFRTDKMTRVVEVTQEMGMHYQVSPDKTGMPSDAVQLAEKMIVGWNLGNALEAATSPIQADETLWGNPKTTQSLIDAVKAAGFNAVRIPCAWSGYIEDQKTYRIRDTWLSRVKEVVDYCVQNDMYAVLNIHWDGGWLEEHPLYAYQASVNEKHKAIWEQIASYFRDYDEHLLFAGTNEVRASYNTPTAENIEVQESYNQTFVDAVRSTGGRNVYRNLVIQSYNTNIQFAVDYLKMPRDLTKGRLMVEVHAYDPWDFAGDEKSDKYLWGEEFSSSVHVSTWGQEEWIDANFSLMKTHFIAKGIPVILGEYGAMLRSGLPTEKKMQDHRKSRNNYLTYVTKTAKKHGMVPFYWDNGVWGANGFGLFDRSSNRVAHQDAVDAIMGGL